MTEKEAMGLIRERSKLNWISVVTFRYSADIVRTKEMNQFGDFKVFQKYLF